MTGSVRRRPNGRSALLVIGGLFLLSALLRLSSGAGPAIASQVAALTSPEIGAEPAQCEPPPDIAAILGTLRQREADVAEKEQELLTLESSLSLASDQVRTQIVALERAEQDLAALIALSDSAAENDLARLTNVYENMKPKDAAGLFEAMDPDFAAGFVARMRPEAAAQIMTGLSPQLAYSISVILAGRNANAPTQ